MSQSFMNKFIEERWTKELNALTESEISSKEAKEVRESLAKQDLRFPLRLGLIARLPPLETFRKDALEKVTPLLNQIDLKYKSYICTGASNHSESAEWIIPAFEEVILAIYGRFDNSRQAASWFDKHIREVKSDSPQDISSLEVLSRFLTEFSAELAIRLPPSFDQVAYLYFETIFRHYEASHPVEIGSSNDSIHLEISNTDTILDAMAAQQKEANTEAIRQHGLNDSNSSQQLGKKRRRVMQDGRFAMDLFVDDMDDEIVEQIFHRGHGTSGIEVVANDDQMQGYLSLCLHLEEIGFAARMTDVVTRMLYKKVEEKIFGSFKKQWSVATLDCGKDWMSYIILPFLRHTLLPKRDQEDSTGRKRYKMWASRLEFYFFKTFGDLRIKEFFDIIVEHPESTPAVKDLSICIKWTGQRDQLQNAIIPAIEKRLLHPGAETADIIEFYTSTIKYLRMLDPSGVMLDQTAKVISRYLRTRDDTMRAIVSCIVDDSSDLLANTTEGIQVNADLDDEGSDDDSWVPEPVNSGPDLSSARRRMADIISVLANIYNTNDRFIKEFQASLADRLLNAADFQVDREVRQLELMKLRFGETDLQQCEVMLADIAESKRINTNIQSLDPNLNVSATIASRYYWPEIEDEGLKLSDNFDRLLKSYNSAFETLKPAQKLIIFPSLGMVDLELELSDRTLNIQVLPIHAAIIELFEEKNIWTLTDISTHLQIAEDTLEQKIRLWVREGVLKETSRFQYQLIEELSS
ncbi:Anaphase-promoting complex subunit 2 [Entomortierella beljakovae]|nr:Anaphase-promoting complex subunit 2 [Entomortierella beljakovae]